MTPTPSPSALPVHRRCTRRGQGEGSPSPTNPATVLKIEPSLTGGELFGLVDDSQADGGAGDRVEGVDGFDGVLHRAFGGEVGGDDDGDELGLVHLVLAD